MIDERSLNVKIQTQMSSYKVNVKIFKRVEKFIENVNGKIDRKRVLECTEIRSKDALYSTPVSDELPDIQKIVFDVIVSNLSEKISSNISVNMDLNSIGLDSITFIKMIVALECEFDFEFDDEMLIITEFPTVKSIVEYVAMKISTN